MPSAIRLASTTLGALVAKTIPIEQFGFEVQAQIGEFIAKGEDIPVLGTGVDGYVEVSLKPIPQLVFEPRIAYSQLTHPETQEDIFKGYIARLRTNLQFSRRLFFRLVTQYNNFSNRVEVDPLLTYKVTRFVVARRVRGCRESARTNKRQAVLPTVALN